MTAAAVEALADRVLVRPRCWTADTLGNLHLSDAERTALRGIGRQFEVEVLADVTLGCPQRRREADSDENSA
jgi:hypothetical protein